MGIKVETGCTFGRAFCTHMGLSASKVMGDVKVVTERNSVFGVTLTLALTADDLTAIASIMRNGVSEDVGVPVIAQPMGSATA